MKIIYLLLFLSVLGFKPVLAQSPVINKDSLTEIRKIVNENYIQIYKENGDLSYTSPLGEIGAPGKYVINGKISTTYMALGTKDLPVAISIVPDFTVRVRNEASDGVRTPSFRLGGIFYVRLNKSSSHYKYATLRFTHHSNGQDGDARNPDGMINTHNGNFNTNYLTIAYHFGEFSPIVNNTYYSLNHEAGFEWHKWFNYEKALEDDYGFTRFIYNFSLRRYIQDKENWRLNAEFDYAVNSMSEYSLAAIKKRLNTEISFHYSFPFMNNVFLMAAAGYYGEDPYNIYYQNKYAYLRFGISSGFMRHKANAR